MICLFKKNSILGKGKIKDTERTDKKDNNSKLRNSSLELLRIIAIILIILHHITTNAHGFLVEDLSLPKIRFILIVVGGKIGVNIFILISGYHLINDTRILNLKKIIKLLGEIIFYSLIIDIVFMLFGYIHFSGNIYTYIFPLTHRIRWFISVYFVLYLIHPLLNRALINLDKNGFQRLLILLVLSRIIITIFFPASGEGFNNQLLRFISLYTLAAYIKLHVNLDSQKDKQYLKFGIYFYILTFLLNLLVAIFESKSFRSLSPELHNLINVGKPYTFTILAASLYLFIAFASKKIKYNKPINTLASTVFGIYLIHEHPLIRSKLWGDWLNLYNYQYSNIIIPYSIVIVMIIFCSCALIDLARQKFIEKHFLNFINNKMETIKKWLCKIIDSIKILGDPFI